MPRCQTTLSSCVKEFQEDFTNAAAQQKIHEQKSAHTQLSWPPLPAKRASVFSTTARSPSERSHAGDSRGGGRGGCSCHDRGEPGRYGGLWISIIVVQSFQCRS